MDNTSVSEESSAYNRSIGLEDDDNNTTITEAPAIAQADRDALQKAAAAPVAGLTTTAPHAGETIPDFLNDSPETADELTPPDYTAEYKSYFGAESLGAAEVVDRDRLLVDVVTGNQAESWLQENAPDYLNYQEFANREYPDAEARQKDDIGLIEQAIRNQAGASYTDSLRDEKIRHYVDEEGKLKPEGTKWADSIRGSIKDQVNAWREEALKQGKIQATAQLTDDKTFIDALKTAKVAGLAITDDADRTRIENLVLSGPHYQFLKGFPHAERAQQAVFLDPYLRGKFLREIYKKGAEEGGKQKLASRLN